MHKIWPTFQSSPSCPLLPFGASIVVGFLPFGASIEFLKVLFLLTCWLLSSQFARNPSKAWLLEFFSSSRMSSSSTRLRKSTSPGGSEPEPLKTRFGSICSCGSVWVNLEVLDPVWTPACSVVTAGVWQALWNKQNQNRVTQNRTRWASAVADLWTLTDSCAPCWDFLHTDSTLTESRSSSANIFTVLVSKFRRIQPEPSRNSLNSAWRCGGHFQRSQCHHGDCLTGSRDRNKDPVR